MRARAARDRIDDDARRRAGGRARANRAAVSWSSSRPSTRITPYCRIAASTTASAPVSLPVWEAAVRAPVSVRPTLTATTGTPRAGGPVGGEQEGAAVLEALDVAGDGADLGPLGEVGDEVGGLQIGLVAGGGPVGEADAEFLEGEDGAALVAGLGDQGDRRARRGRRGSRSKALRLVLGPSSRRPGAAPRRRRAGPARRRPPRRSRRSRRRRRRRTSPWPRPVPRSRGGGRRRAVRRGRPVRAGRRRRGRRGCRRRSARVGCTGCSRAPTRSAQASSCRVIPVFGRPSASEAPTTATDSGPEEAVQIGDVGVQRAAADVEVVGLGGPAVHDRRGVLAAGDDPGPAGVGGEGAVG